MSLENRRQAAQEQKEARFEQAASMLYEELQYTLFNLHEQQALQLNTNATFYKENEDGSMKEVPGHEERCRVVVGNKTFEVADRTYDDPETGEPQHAYFIGGEELLIDRTSQGIEGPFGILLFTDPNTGEFESVQAKCFQDNRTAPMSAELIRDTALALHETRTVQGITPAE